MATQAEVNTLFLRLSRRAESVDRAKLVETFVDVGPLFTLLSSTDHQVIYGRRGTGKTHAILYLDSTARSKGSLSVYVDLRTIGSTGGLYSDPNMPITERATRLLMDTLAAIHDSLLEQVLDSPDLDLQRLGPVLDRLAESITEVVVTGTVQIDESRTDSASAHRTDGGAVSLSPDRVSAELRSERSTEASAQEASRVIRSGTAQHRVHFGRVGNALRDVVGAVSPRRVWVLLDEWSVVPAELQPYLADLLRRSLFPLAGVTVKLGCIEQRTHLQLTGERGDYVGIEIGADASADVNLDDFMVFENDPERATRFFQELIYKHVRSLEAEHAAASDFRAASDVVQRGFTQRNTFDEFVRAAEGVPRDAINILSLSAQRALDNQISMEDVRAAAKVWYQRDKEAAASANADAKLLLHWIIDEVIAHRRARGFLLRADDQHPLIDALFDARVLHILKRNISSHDQPGVRYDAYKIDYGCYVDLLTTVRGPHGLLLAGDSDEDGSYLDVPPDDYRAIRRAILDLRGFETANRGVRS